MELSASGVDRDLQDAGDRGGGHAGVVGDGLGGRASSRELPDDGLLVGGGGAGVAPTGGWAV